MIFESVITTQNENGSPHITPMGIRYVGERVVIAPFMPSTTRDNLRRAGTAVINMTDNVAIVAGCLTGRRTDWPVVPAHEIDGVYLRDALSHCEVEVEEVEEDNLRPRFLCAQRHRATHAPFAGFNRAQAAVVEAAILVSRLEMLPRDKIEREMGYLQIAIDKTAGPREQQAWHWLSEAVTAFYHTGRGDGA